MLNPTASCSSPFDPVNHVLFLETFPLFGFQNTIPFGFPPTDSYSFSFFFAGSPATSQPLLERGEGAINWSTGIETYTLPYTKYITNKNLLYSTGNSIEYSVMIYMGIESRKEHIQVHVELIHFAGQQKLSQHCKSIKNYMCSNKN